MNRGRLWRDKIVHVPLEGGISKSKTISTDLQGIEKNLFLENKTQNDSYPMLFFYGCRSMMMLI
jgi:hypothetical protein